MIFNVFMLKLDEQTFWVSPSGGVRIHTIFTPLSINHEDVSGTWKVVIQSDRLFCNRQQLCQRFSCFIHDMFLHFRESSEEFPEKPDDNLFAL